MTTIDEVSKLLGAEYLVPPLDPDQAVRSCYAADMMSDVLAFSEYDSCLITGLMNVQVIRTAEIKDLACIIFTRGKLPKPDLVEMAQDKGICIMFSLKSTFNVCGILYENGLRGSRNNE